MVIGGAWLLPALEPVSAVIQHHLAGPGPTRRPGRQHPAETPLLLLFFFGLLGRLG